MSLRHLALLMAAVALALGACSDDGDPDEVSEPEPEAEDTTTSTTAAEGGDEDDTADDRADVAVIEPSPVSAPIDQIYPGTEIISAGQVTADWYQEDGYYVVVYSGLDLAAIGPACPGNSIQLSDGTFSSVSNAPTAEGGCEGATTPEPPEPPQVCGDLIVYRTAISISDQGTLYGSFEQPSGDGFVGGTSTVAADAAAAPEIVTGSPAFSFDGTEYTC